MPDTQSLLHTPTNASSGSTSGMTSTGQEHENYVQLCPHQVLTFEIFQRIVNLPNIKTARSFDAFQEPHRHITRPALSSKRCFVNSREINVDFVNLNAYLKYQERSTPEFPDTFVLHVDWECLLRMFPLFKDRKSRDSVRKTLERSKIWVCPHMRLSDDFLVDATYNFLNPPDLNKLDPIARYELLQQGYPAKWCDRCHTLVQVTTYERWDGPTIRFWTSRWLGLGASADDPYWTRQCALRQNEG